MSLASCLHELTTLVRSYHPLIVIETAEEDRARRVVDAASRRLGVSFFEWSLARGLRFGGDSDRGGNAIAGTHEPAGVLRHLLTLERPGIFLLKDFAAHFDDPGERPPCSWWPRPTTCSRCRPS